MINLFENFRSVVNDGKVKSKVDIDVNSNSTKLLSSNVIPPTPSAAATPPNPRSEGSNPVQTVKTSSETKTNRRETVPENTSAQEKIPEKSKPETTSPAKVKREASKLFEPKPETASSSAPEKASSSAPEKALPSAPEKVLTLAPENASNSVLEKASPSAKKIVELSVDNAPMETENRATNRATNFGPATLKREVDEIDSDKIDEFVRAEIDDDVEDDNSESKSTTQSLPSQSSSNESLPSKENPNESRLDSSAPLVRAACNTCEFLDEAPVHCHTCRRAYCKNCSVTPSTAGLPWSCFLCQLEATRRPETMSVRVLRSGERKPSVEPLAKRRRSNRAVDAKPSPSSASSSSSSSSLSTASSTSSTANSRDATLDSSILESDDQLPSAVSPSKTSPAATTRKLECSATISGNRTIEIKFQPSRTTMIYGGGGGGGPGSRNRLSASLSQDSVDAGLMEVEDPVIVDHDNTPLEAEEEDYKDEDDDDDDDDDEEEANVETRLLPEEGDSTQTLTGKLNQALEEIRRLKAKKKSKEEETKRVRRRLAWTRAHLETAEKNLVDVVAAGNRGRSNAGVAPPGICPPPPKSSPNMMPWTEEEVNALREAVAECGPGQWKLMHEKYKDRFHPLRTRFNIRDRYKLMKAKHLW